MSWTQEQRYAASQRAKERWTNGSLGSEETREKRRKASARRWSKPEERARASEKGKNFCKDPEHIKKMSERTSQAWADGRINREHSIKGGETRKKNITEAERKELSERFKEKWKDPKHREKVSSKIKEYYKTGRFGTKEHREGLSKEARKQWADGRGSIHNSGLGKGGYYKKPRSG